MMKPICVSELKNHNRSGTLGDMHAKPVRPIGITLLSVLFVSIGGFGTLVLPIFILTGTPRTLAQLCETQLHWSHALSIGAATLLCVLWYTTYVLYLCIGIGLWKLRRLALKAIIVTQWFGMGLGIIASLILLRYEPLLALGVGVWCAGLLGCVLWYLTRPAVRWPFEFTYAFAHGLTAPLPPPPSTAATWTKVCIGVGLAAVILTTFVGGLFTTVEKSFQSSDVYKLGLKTAQESPCVISALGSPLVSDGMTSGSISSSSSQGRANLSVPVRGPKGTGDLSIDAEKFEGSWKLHTLTLDSSNHTFQILPAPSPCQ